ncbi:MAG: 50S ribosomal protein L32 [Candidatus Pacebacteria bacterium]|jgi:large subunit ribosomal protein L32|nr:50S ribosomal protein L32 [Candidatus Paceibacterota bacterium]
MALPKKRHSKTRGKKRRTHWKLSKVNLSPCPQCKQPRLAHHACKVCGYYNGKSVVEIAVKEKKKKS